jgi:hypothetical protein
MTDDCRADEKRVTRREAMALLSVSGVALAQLSASVHAQETTPNSLAVARPFSTVAALKNATDLAAGTLAQTLGFYTAGDGGAATYLIASPAINSETKTAVAANEGDVFALQNGLHATLLEGNAVNYRMLGAKSDGQSDDGIAINMAHDYANRRGLPIVNPGGEFWIKQTNSIPVKTNVHWGQSVFHIDEQFNAKNAARFIVHNDEPTQAVTLDEKTKAAIIARLKPGVMVIPELAPYKNCLVQVQDANERIGLRSGEKYKGQGRVREEFFYVEEDGRIVGDIAWEFKDITTFNVKPCGDDYLVVEGGGFYFSGDNPGTKYTSYYQNGISIQRSRTIVRNQWCGLEKGRADISMEPRGGIYVLSMVYDVTLENIRLIPWEQNRSDPDKKVGAGTYGIGGARMLQCTFRNVTAEGTLLHWGVFGTNLVKDFRIDKCHLNRVDVHFHCWNLYISDSVIGLRGISVTGGGHLWIENTVRHGNQFINFRRDYGAVWNGDVSIRNCRLLPDSGGEVSILYNRPANADYGYQVGSARTIKIEDLTVDYSAAPDSTSPCWLMTVVPFSISENGSRFFFPHDATFHNILVTGREQGVRLVQIVQPAGFDMARDGSYDGVRLQPNSRLFFDNIQLEKIDPAAPAVPANSHFQLGDGKPASAMDKRSLYPRIHFSHCENIRAFLTGGIADVSFAYCSLEYLQTQIKEQPFQGKLAFTECAFSPVIFATGNPEAAALPVYALDAELGTSFTNCTLHLPRAGQTAKPEFLDHIGFVQLNRKVRHAHLNTALGNDILHYYKTQNITLTPQFINMLKAHHALESEDVA